MINEIIVQGKFYCLKKGEVNSNRIVLKNRISNK